MPYIDPSAVRPLFTSDLIAAATLEKPPTDFLLGKYVPVVKDTLYLEWNVKTFNELMATDVVRGSDGIRMEATKFTRKVEKPPFFYYYMDVVQLQGYDRAFGSSLISESVYNDFQETALAELMQMRYLIQRRYEYMVSQIYTSGIVTYTANGTPTDFLRKPASIKAFDASIDWTQPTVDPTAVLDQLGIFVRTVGKATSGVLDCYLGAAAYKALRDNPIIQSRAQKLWNALTDLQRPVPKGDGSLFVGQIDTGTFTMDMYTYPQFFNPDASTPDVFVPYIPDNMVIVVDKAPIFRHMFSGIPKLPAKAGMNENTNFAALGSTAKGNGQYFVSEFMDEKRTAWEVAVKSAGLPNPIQVNAFGNAFVTPA